ncbi:hypothetical protein [Streptomyces sp. NBC_00996]|uniref:hypothetical protein n=1 Tax=Streptomyces sp. NBC_00996 TaxID=2903710 RepID=UPI00386E8BD5|nr:hypothetical protein OG390_09200 [Streptomyces sp. NBC_00996]
MLETEPAHEIDEFDSAAEHEDRDRPATDAGRFAPRGLLKRRRPESDTDGCDSPQFPPQRVGSAPPLPESPLPPGLLPLPAGFELSTTTSPPAGLLLDADTS